MREKCGPVASMHSGLEKKTVAQLRQTAKELQIRGRSKMRKHELIEAIEKREKANKSFHNPIKKPKGHYIENARIGTLIAFKVNNKKTLSGKVSEIHKSLLVLETKNGTKYNVKKEDIIWVLSSGRWPKGVYKELKGIL